MKMLLKAGISLLLFVLILTEAHAADTMRSGSSGSAGTTAQGPVYDGGVQGPNATMGDPEATNVNRPASGAIITKKKSKTKGSLRNDTGNPANAVTPSPSPSVGP